MTRTTRRYFIKVSAAAGGAFGLGIKSRILFAGKAVTPLRILILGGTGFTGPYQVRYALSRGHKVTTFNRGKTHPRSEERRVGKESRSRWTRDGDRKKY